MRGQIIDSLFGKTILEGDFNLLIPLGSYNQNLTEENDCFHCWQGNLKVKPLIYLDNFSLKLNRNFILQQKLKSHFVLIAGVCYNYQKLGNIKYGNYELYPDAGTIRINTRASIFNRVLNNNVIISLSIAYNISFKQKFLISNTLAFENLITFYQSKLYKETGDISTELRIEKWGNSYFNSYLAYSLSLIKKSDRCYPFIRLTIPIYRIYDNPSNSYSNPYSAYYSTNIQEIRYLQFNFGMIYFINKIRHDKK